MGRYRTDQTCLAGFDIHLHLRNLGIESIVFAPPPLCGGQAGVNWLVPHRSPMSLANNRITPMFLNSSGNELAVGQPSVRRTSNVDALVLHPQIFKFRFHLFGGDMEQFLAHFCCCHTGRISRDICVATDPGSDVNGCRLGIGRDHPDLLYGNLKLLSDDLT